MATSPRRTVTGRQHRRNVLAALASLSTALFVPAASTATATASPATATAGTGSAGQTRPSKGAPSPVGAPVRRTANQGALPSLGQAARVSSDGKLQLAFHATGPTGGAEEAAITALGATGVRSLNLPADLGVRAGVVEGWVPRAKVEAAARLGWVASVSSPSYGRFSPHGGTKDSAVDAAQYLRTKGITGAGVKVGVVSDGVQAIGLAQLAGELPNVTVVDQATAGLGTGNEGIAMLEIVHDMAPGAQLFFHAAGLPPAGPGMDPDVTQVTLVNAFVALANAGVNVIVHDVGFFDEPLFQKGLVATVSENLADRGISVHSAAGNDAATHAARVPAVGTGHGPDGKAGPFANCSIDPGNAVAIAPNGDTTFDITIPPGQFQAFVLQWSEPRAVFPTPTRGGFTDLDLYLMDENLTQCYGESDLEQADGVGDSFEGFFGTSPFATPVRAKLVVNAFDPSSAVAPPILDLRWFGAGAVDTPSATATVDGVNNFTAGKAAAAGAFFATGVEPFSSRGPVELRTTTDCPPGTNKAPDAPCTGVAGPPAQVFPSPAWVTLDQIPVSGAGGFPTTFTGTSAAAPVAGGCDALVRSAVGAPAAPVASIFARLADSAVDIFPEGPDYGSGAGLLDCNAAASIAALRLVAEPATATAVRGATVDVTVDVTNGGPDLAPRAALVEVVPAGLTLVAPPAGCSAAAGANGTTVITCPRLHIQNGDRAHFAFSVQVPADAAPGASFTLDGTLSSAFDPSLADNADSVVITVTAPLPSTGGTAGGWPLAAGGVAALAGLFGLALSRRSRTAAGTLALW